MRRALDLDQLGVRGVGHEPVRRRPVVGERLGAAPEDGRNGQPRDVERRHGRADGGDLAGQCRPVGPPGLLGLLGQAVPGRVADHPAEEALGHHRRVLVVDPTIAGGTATGPGGRRSEPGHRRLVGGDGQDRTRTIGTERRAQGDVTAVAVADHHAGPSVDDRKEVPDVAVQRVVDRRDVPRAVVAATVVRHRMQVVEPARHAGEAAGTVERAVDQHDDRGTPRGWVGHVFGQRQIVRVGHPGQPDSTRCSTAIRRARGREPPSSGVRGRKCTHRASRSCIVRASI